VVSLRLYAKDAKLLAERLAEQISNSDYEEARLTAMKLHDELLKHLMTRGINTNELSELFHRLDFYLRTHSDGANKRKLLLSILAQIDRKTKNPTGDPVETIVDIYDALMDVVPFSKENIGTLKALIRELHELRSDFMKLRDVRYNYYIQMMQEAEKMQTTLARLSGGLDTKQALNDLAKNYSDLLMAMQKVMTPPLRLEISPEKVSHLVEKGVPIQEISKATGHSEDELRAMLTQARIEATQGAENA